MHRIKQLQKTEEKEIAESHKDHRPVIQQDGGKTNFHDSTEFMTIDQRETMRELGDSQLVGTSPPLPLPPPAAAASASTSTSTSSSTALVVPRDVQMADVDDSIVVKRKRGRPPRAQGKLVPSPLQKKQAVVDEEEDVCFICFDGGSLVLCDRRGCPKAYHPSCIKRDEEFFRSKAKWNCGWHICSSCQKASYYMCYTCTYSLCKGCTKDVDYVCVRNNKGFCGTCMKTIMLIENVKMENVEQVQVDFDDKTSWEYLFKVYWVYLKDKEFLTIDELVNANNPWKGEELPKARNSWRRNGFATRKEILTGEHVYANNEKVSSLDYCGRNGEETLSKRRKTNDQSNQIEKSSLITDKSTVEKVISFPEGKIWATKALLEFVSHMKDGDLSMLSQSDVQDLILEYINRNNLRDPHQKNEVVCDARLKNLFRRPRVGHLEMFKLLEYHFLTNERTPPANTVRKTVADALSGQLEGAGCNDSRLAVVNDGHHITNRKMNEKGSPVNPNADEYAAIDVHNIKLLYLKSNLMEKLLDDGENFQEKVVGSFVRIRIAVVDAKQDVYRLVQVAGTCKADESYKVGSRTTNMKLEVLNLGKKEAISIDEISNQDFSEDECRRLRETVKCGLIKPLKVGEILEKAMVLQPVKVSDSLEVEMLQLTDLHDRASEKGHRKQLREYVGKLELLKSLKERERRLLEIPSVHMDPKMDPNYVSKEDAEDRDDNGQGDHARLNNNTGLARNGIELNSSPGEGDLNDFGHRALKTLAAASEQVEMNSRLDLESTVHIQEQGNAASCGLSIPNTSKNQLGDTGSVIPPPLSSGNEISASDLETEKLWNYRDPSGKIQGPFSMLQLRKWSEMKIFPDDFRVWKVDEKQQDSILLTEALIGRFPKKPLQPHILPEEHTVNKKQEHGRDLGTDATREDNERADHKQKQLQKDGQYHGNTSNEPIKSNGLDTHSMSWIKAADAAVTDGSHAQAPLQVQELPEGSKSTGQSQICASLPASSSSGKSMEAPLLNEREGSSNPSNAKEYVEKQSESAGYSSQSAENCRPQSINSSTIGWDSSSSFLSMVKLIAKPEQNQKFDFSIMPSTAPLQASEAPKNPVAESKLPASTNVLVQDSVQPNRSTASTIVIGDRQVPAVSVDWLSFSSAPAKNPVEQWDINLVSPSSLKPGGTTGDHTVTPTSGVDQLTLSSSSHPTIDASNWHSMVPEPTEFCSLVDESVSDLLAEVEAMESLNGLPSPTSKFRYDLELAPGSDDDCFSPVERFNPAPDQSKSNAVSSTSEIQIPPQLSVVEKSLCLSLMPTQPTATNEPLAVSQMPADLISKPLAVSQMPADLISKSPHLQQGIVQSKPSPVTEKPLSIWKRDPTDPHKSLDGQQPSSSEVNGDAKHREVSVNQWDMNLDVQPLESSAEQHQVGSNLQAPVTSTLSQLEHGSIKNSGPTVHTSQRTDKGTPSSGHGATQQQASTNSGVSSSRNQGNWGSQSRHGSDSRHSSHRENRHHYHSRDSGSSRDRYSGQRDNRSQGNWDRQPAYGSGGNVGGSYKGSSRGQRVCKFYESGYCKRGASCSYWHP